MQGNSRQIISNQTGPNPGLKKIVLKHKQSEYRQPLKLFSQTIFARVNQIKEQFNRPLILDAGCGTGESTQLLAKRFVDHLVIGIDKSQHRLKSHLSNRHFYQQDNFLIVRAELIDFWRLAVKANWQIDRQYLFYPNPWPKKKQESRRWYAHPVFPTILKLGGRLECRSNWPLYIDEFSRALGYLNQNDLKINLLRHKEATTPFEWKYQNSRHSLHQLVCQLS